MGCGNVIRIVKEFNDDYSAKVATTAPTATARPRPPQPIPNTRAATAAAESASKTAIPRPLHEVLRRWYLVLGTGARRRTLHEVLRQSGRCGDHEGEELGTVEGVRIRYV